MASNKKNTLTTAHRNLPALKIGSRVRCTDDGVTGRIVWTNAVSVKIQWDDGEQVTWKRDALASRPIEILEDDAPALTDSQAVEPPASATAEEANATKAPSEPTPAEVTSEPLAEAPVPEPILATAASQPPAEVSLPEATPAAQLAPAPETAVSASVFPEPVAADVRTTATKPPRTRKGTKSQSSGEENKLSALDAAAKVLAEESRPMSCPELIAAMAAKSYWTSPGGKTPAATLYSAILRELTIRGDNARFVKTERGKFARKG
jgi:HB1, ASXL, restriction endonuclease HTH domain